MADTCTSGSGEGSGDGSDTTSLRTGRRGDKSAGAEGEPGTEVSKSSNKGTVKGWLDWLKGQLTTVVAIQSALVAIVGAASMAYVYMQGFKPIENFSSVSVKEHYVPRVDEMKMMEAKFTEMEEKWRNVHPQDKGTLAHLYLTGKPGRGKTQLALGYARKFYDDRWFHRYMFSCVAVLHLDASNLAESYPKALELLNPNISTKQMTLDQMRTKVEEELKDIARWLIVVDNVNSTFPIPKVVGRQVGRIVLVTSNRNVLNPDFDPEHKLGGMTEQEAVQLLKKTSGHDGEHDKAKELVNFLGLVPLSITSAGVYIKKKRSRDPTSYSFGDYQEQCNNVTVEASKLAVKYGLIDKRMHQSVRDAVMAILEDDKDDTFRKVFTLLAFGGDSPVPMTLIARLLGISPHEDKLCQSLDKVRDCVLLDRYCYATSDDKSEDVRIQKETITVDSFTRSVLREEFKDPNKSDIFPLLQQMREAFIEVGLDEEKKDTNEWYEIRRKLIPHMESVQEATDATKGYKEDSQMSCDYEYVVGKCYANSIPEELGKAEEHLNNAVKHCPKQSERLVDIYYELGNIKRRQDSLEESMKSYQLCPTTGIDKKKKFRIAEGRSKTHIHLGEFEEVKKIFQDLDGSYTEKESTTMYTQLGVALVWLGEGEQAEKYLKKALDHSNERQKLRPMTSLVRVYHLMGRYEESLDLLNKMQMLYSETDKLESGGLAIVKGRLSATHHFLNNRTESIKHAKETLKRVKAMQKTDSKNVGIAIALICLGPVYSELDEAFLKEAEDVLEAAKDGMRDPYFHYTRMVAQLGKVKQLRHKPDKAKKILEELHEQTKLPHDHIGCRDLFDYLGQVYYTMGMYKESLEAFESCQKIVDHYYRHYPEHSDVQYVRQQASNARQARNT